MELVTLKNDKLTVVISPKGAEIQSIVDENGVERMFDGNPAFWAKRAPILFPVAGGLKDDGYEWQGKWYPMPKHGFIRPLTWQVERADEKEAAFLLKEKHEGFPFEYELRAIYTLCENRLTINFAVTNRDQTSFCYSIGSHEAYAAPEGIERYEILFDEEEDLLHSPLLGSLNDHEPVPIALHTRVLPLKYEYFKVDALVFRSLKSRGVTLRSQDHARTVRVDFPDEPFLLLWTKPNAPYICIEPWCNGPDFVDAPAQIDKKPGFICIAPGQTVEKRHMITIG